MLKLFDGPSFIREYISRGGGIQTASVIDQGKLCFIVKVIQKDSDQLSLEQMRGISIAFFEFLTEDSRSVRNPIRGHSYLILEQHLLKESFKTMISTHLNNLVRGIVIWEKGGHDLNVKYFSTGTPDSIDSIVSQISFIAERGVFEQELEIKWQPGFLTEEHPSKEHKTELRRRISEIIARNSLPNLQGVFSYDSKSVQVVRRPDQPSQYNDEERIRALKIFFSDLPSLKAFQGKDGLQKVFSTTKGIFNELSFNEVLQLLLFCSFNAKEQDKGLPFNLPSCSTQPLRQASSSSSSSSSFPSDPVTIESITVNQGNILLFGKALHMLDGGAINSGFLSLLTSLIAYLGGVSAQKSLKAKAVDGIPPFVLEEIKKRFTAALGTKRCNRLDEVLYSQLNEPIKNLKRTKGAQEELLSPNLIHFSVLVKKLRLMLIGLANNQRQHDVEVFEPRIHQLIEECAKRQNWTTDKVNSVQTSVCEQFKQILQFYSLFFDQEAMLEELSSQTLNLIPLSKLGRLRREGKPQEIYAWVQRNWTDLESVNDLVSMQLVRYKNFCSGRSKFLGQILALMGEHGLYDQTENLALPTARELISSTPEPEIAGLMELFAGDYLKIDYMLCLCEKGNNLLEKLFTGLRTAKERQVNLEALMTSSSRRSLKGRARKVQSKGRKQQAPEKGKVAKSQDLNIEKAKPLEPVEQQFLKMFVTQDPIGGLHTSMLEAINNYGAKLTNSDAKKILENVLEFYKDLFSELCDLPDPSQPSHVVDYTQRVVVLLSQLLEQMISVHKLQRQDSQSPMHRLVSHNSLFMLSDSGLEETFPEIRNAVESVNLIEWSARHFYTHEPATREALGFQLLNSADELLTQPESGPSSGIDRLATAHSVITTTKELASDHLNLISRILGVSLDFTPIRDLAPSSFPIRRSESDSDLAAPLIKRVDPLLERMERLISQDSVGSSTDRPFHGYLKDARRLLVLIKARLERHSEENNARNFFKTLASLTALVLEFTAVTMAVKSGKMKSSRVKWNSSFHRLTHWFEKLGFYKLTPTEEDFLEACDLIHRLTRYSAHYQELQGIDPVQELYLRLKGLRSSDSTNLGGIGETAWQPVRGNLKKAVAGAVRDVYERVETGLGLLSQLLDKLEQF